MKILYRKNENWDFINFKYPTQNISKEVIIKKLEEKYKDMKNISIDIVDTQIEKKCEMYSMVSVFYAIIKE